MKKLVLFSSLSFISSLTWANAQPEAPRPLKLTPKVERYIKNIAKKYHFNPQQLTQTFKKTQYIPEVIARINHPYEQKPWNFYRQYFVTPTRIKEGAQYWQAHQKVLRIVSQRYGVPASIIVAIIGIESNYGEIRGDYQEIGALATLAFHYPKRQAFFTKELTQYLLLARQMYLPVLKMQGSYAGALGIPQFMPSSYRHYAVNYSKNKTLDLVHNNDDAIASVANYLKKAGWLANQPIASKAIYQTKPKKAWISESGKPNYTLAQLKKLGIHINGRYRPYRKACLIALEDSNGKQYWVSYQNFYAIMRYNTSMNYAMAVYQLSQKIRQAHARQLT